MDRQRPLKAPPDREDHGEDRREDRGAGRERHVVVVAHVVGDQRAEDTDDHDDQPVGRRDVAAQRELHGEQDGQQDAGDDRRVGQPEAEVDVQVIGRGLADRRAHDLDHPEVEGDLGDLVEHPATERRADCVLRVRVGDGRRRLRGGDGDDRQPEVCDAVRKIDVEPAHDVVGRGCDDDLFESLLVERLLDGVHRVVAGRDLPGHRPTGRALDRRQRAIEHGLRGGRLLVALGVGRVPLGRRRIRHEHEDVDRAAGGALADGRKQLGRRGGMVGDDEDARPLMSGQRDRGLGHRAWSP